MACVSKILGDHAQNPPHSLKERAEKFSSSARVGSPEAKLVGVRTVLDGSVDTIEDDLGEWSPGGEGALSG